MDNLPHSKSCVINFIYQLQPFINMRPRGHWVRQEVNEIEDGIRRSPECLVLSWQPSKSWVSPVLLKEETALEIHLSVSSSCGLDGFADHHSSLPCKLLQVPTLRRHLRFGRAERNGDLNFPKAAGYSLGSAEHLTVGTEVGFQSSVSGGVNAVWKRHFAFTWHEHKFWISLEICSLSLQSLKWLCSCMSSSHTPETWVLKMCLRPLSPLPGFVKMLLSRGWRVSCPKD